MGGQGGRKERDRELAKSLYTDSNFDRVAMSPRKPTAEIFHGCTFSVDPVMNESDSRDFGNEGLQYLVESIVERGGAVDDVHFTHYITDKADASFARMDAVEWRPKPVNQKWVRECLRYPLISFKIAIDFLSQRRLNCRLPELSEEDLDVFLDNPASNNQIFAGTFICIANMHPKVEDILVNGIEILGGRATSRFSNECTHVIAGFVRGPECHKAIESSQIKILPIKWYVDSIKEQDLCAEAKYDLRCILESSENKVDLTRLKDFQCQVEKWIMAGGGSLCEATACHYYILEEGHGEKPPKHAKCRTIQWMKECFQFCTMIWPKKSLVWKGWTFYPYSQGMVKGGAPKRISVTGYTGHCRDVLIKIINLSGAEATKELTKTNTHLISTTCTSKKVNAARDWGLKIIGHQWLMDSVVSGKWLIEEDYSIESLFFAGNEEMWTKLEPNTLKDLPFVHPLLLDDIGNDCDQMLLVDGFLL
eukprot:757923-Hanusia_phi.AAC.5